MAIYPISNKKNFPFNFDRSPAPKQLLQAYPSTFTPTQLHHYYAKGTKQFLTAELAITQRSSSASSTRNHQKPESPGLSGNSCAALYECSVKNFILKSRVKAPELLRRAFPRDYKSAAQVSPMTRRNLLPSPGSPPPRCAVESNKGSGRSPRDAIA